MSLYQLGNYNTKQDLSPQATAIRDFVLTHFDYASVRMFVARYDFLEDESIQILRMAILAGYWTSYYGFSWTPQQEVSFWELVCTKNTGYGLAILTLAESYRGNKFKTLKEVLPLYYKAIEIEPYHFYSIFPDDNEELEADPELKHEFVKIGMDVREKLWSRQSFEEEYQSLINYYQRDPELLAYVQERLDKILGS